MEIRIIEMLEEIRNILTKTNKDKWCKIDELCEYSSVSQSTIRRAVKRGVLKASTSTGRLLFKKSDVDKWLTR